MRWCLSESFFWNAHRKFLYEDLMSSSIYRSIISFVTVPWLLLLVFGTLTSYSPHCLGSLALAGVMIWFQTSSSGNVIQTSRSYCNKFFVQLVLELVLQLLKGWSVMNSMWHWSLTNRFKVNGFEASRARQKSCKPKARVNLCTELSPVHNLPVTRTVTDLVVAVIYKPIHCAQSPQRVNSPSTAF
jgi:hypothetical protein